MTQYEPDCSSVSPVRSQSMLKVPEDPPLTISTGSPFFSKRSRVFIRRFIHRCEVLRRLRSEEHTSELQSRLHLVCRLLLEKKNRQSAQNANFKKDSSIVVIN